MLAACMGAGQFDLLQLQRDLQSTRSNARNSITYISQDFTAATTSANMTFSSWTACTRKAYVEMPCAMCRLSYCFSPILASSSLLELSESDGMRRRPAGPFNAIALKGLRSRACREVDRWCPGGQQALWPSARRQQAGGRQNVDCTQS
eukprot:365431-Chlamydomonas_euryale.AAC.24